MEYTECVSKNEESVVSTFDCFILRNPEKEDIKMKKGRAEFGRARIRSTQVEGEVVAILSLGFFLFFASGWGWGWGQFVFYSQEFLLFMQKRKSLKRRNI